MIITRGIRAALAKGNARVRARHRQGVAVAACSSNANGGRVGGNASTNTGSARSKSTATIDAFDSNPIFLSEPRTVNVVGAPVCWGQPLGGVEKGPQSIRDAGLRSVVTGVNWRWKDSGDVAIERPSRKDPYAKDDLNIKNAYAVGMANKAIYEASKKAAEQGLFNLCLGGDHSVAMGSIAGVLSVRPRLGVIWVDAHADINLPGTSPSGNIHGMPLSFLMRLCQPDRIPGFEWIMQTPVLHPSRVVYIGLRDIDGGEKKAIKNLKIKAFTMQDIDRHGIGKVMEMAMDHVASDRGAGGKAGPLHLSYDIDALDPSVAPSTGTAVPGGLNYREAHFVAESCAESGLLVSMDMVEVNPELVPGRPAADTVKVGLSLIESALGKTII